ncbi:MAG: BON domain-containing protein [Thermoguttaceae bacterium]
MIVSTVTRDVLTPRAKARSQPVEQEAGPSKERQVVQAEAQSRLRNSGCHALRLVSCDFHEGVRTLRGQLPSFYLKQVAQELVRQVDGAEEVNKHLEVVAPPCSP